MLTLSFNKFSFGVNHTAVQTMNQIRMEYDDSGAVKFEIKISAKTKRKEMKEKSDFLFAFTRNYILYNSFNLLLFCFIFDGEPTTIFPLCMLRSLIHSLG